MSEWIDRKYAGIISNRLDRFVVKSNQPYTANFRCPICGDSQKSKWKARGYFFSKKGGIFYKCHNCSFSGNLNSFLKNVDPTLHKQYVFETFAEGKQSNTATSPFDFSQPKFKPKTILDDLFVPVKGTPAEDYLRDRQVPEKVWPSLYYVDDSQKLEGLSEKYKDRVLGSDPRLVIPFYDLDDTSDVYRVSEYSSSVIDCVRSSSSPAFLHVKTPRYREHVGPGEDFDAGYRSKEVINSWKAKDPLELNDPDLNHYRVKIAEEIDRAIKFALRSPQPTQIDLLEDVL